MATAPKSWVRLDGDAILLPQANPGLPLKGDFERMARRRHQMPTPFREGRWWWVRVWMDDFEKGGRGLKRVKLGPVELSTREAERLRDDYVRPMNQNIQSVGAATKFSAWVADYRAAVMPGFSSSTISRYDSVIDKYLLPAFGEKLLLDLTPLACQLYVSSLAKLTLSHESKDKIRDVLASITKAAMEIGRLINLNPMAVVKMPKNRKGKKQKKPYLLPDQVDKLLSHIAEPYQSVVYVALYTGLRVSELAALKWEDVDFEAHSLTVDERYCRGDWGAPKSESSNTTVPVNPAVTARIAALRSMEVTVRWGGQDAKKVVQVVRGKEPDDLVFQGLHTGAPLHDGNILRRHIAPAAKAIKVKANWQILRRSFAMILKAAGADIKDAQGLMRHSRAQTTIDVYQQFDVPSQRDVANRIVGRVQ
jgi:integrase